MASSAHRVELPDEQLEQFEWLFSSLTQAEKDRFALQLSDIIRQEVVDLERMKRLFADWSMTAVVRHHPQFEHQTKEYRRLADSGDLLIGTSLEQ